MILDQFRFPMEKAGAVDKYFDSMREGGILDSNYSSRRVHDSYDVRFRIDNPEKRRVVKESLIILFGGQEIEEYDTMTQKKLEAPLPA